MGSMQRIPSWSAHCGALMGLWALIALTPGAAGQSMGLEEDPTGQWERSMARLDVASVRSDRTRAVSITSRSVVSPGARRSRSLSSSSWPASGAA